MKLVGPLYYTCHVQNLAYQRSPSTVLKARENLQYGILNAGNTWHEVGTPHYILRIATLRPPVSSLAAVTPYLKKPTPTIFRNNFPQTTDYQLFQERGSLFICLLIVDEKSITAARFPQNTQHLCRIARRLSAARAFNSGIFASGNTWLFISLEYSRLTVQALIPLIIAYKIRGCVQKANT